MTETVDRSAFATIEEALEELRAGRMLIVVDDADRENEGDFVMAAEFATPEAVNFMVTHGRGIVCLPTTGERLEELRIPLMVSKNNESHGTAFAVSIDILGRTTTGTSAYDRAATSRAVTDPTLSPNDVRMPGHVFPLRAVEGGVLRRAGHTEATVDLMRLAGLYPAGVLCEVLNEDGSMARLPELSAVAKRHGVKLISIADLIAYRRRTEHFVHEVAAANGMELTEFDAQFNADLQTTQLQDVISSGQYQGIIVSALNGGKLAIAQPESGPAGKYGKAALERLGVWASVEGSVAQAENVRAALKLVAAGEAALGIVYRTDAISAGRPDQIMPACRRMERSGATPSGGLGAAYELLGDAAHPQFRSVLGIVKTLQAPLPLP